MSTAMPTISPPQPNGIGVQSPNQLNQSTTADSDGQPSPTTTSAAVPGRVQVIPISQYPRARDSTQSLYFDAPTAQSPPMLSAISAAIQVTAADEFIIPIPTAGGTGMQLPNSPNPLPSYQTALKEYREHRLTLCPETFNNAGSENFMASCSMSEDQFRTVKMRGRINFRSFHQMVTHPGSILTREGWWTINNSTTDISRVYDDVDGPFMRPEGTILKVGEFPKYGMPGISCKSWGLPWFLACHSWGIRQL